MVTDKLKKAVSQLRKDGYSPGSSGKVGWLYNPLPFPECDQFPVHRKEPSYEKWALIEGDRPYYDTFKGKSVLDFGCATGFFSFQFAKAGAQVIAVDRDPKAVDVCLAAQEAFGIENASFLHGSFEAFPNLQYHIGLAMTVLNWVGKSGAASFLSWACTHIRVLYVEWALKGDAAKGADWLPTLDAAENWMREVSGYQNSMRVGTSMGMGNKMRTLFRLDNDPPLPEKWKKPTFNRCQAEVHLDGELCYWIANGQHAHKRVLDGWRLCQERLSPPNFPKVYDVGYMREGKYKDVPIVVMENVGGKNPGKVEHKEGFAILQQLKQAEIYHRDIRKGQFIRRNTGELCLVDFGWACAANDVYPVPSTLAGYKHGPHGPDDETGMIRFLGAVK